MNTHFEDRLLTALLDEYEELTSVHARVAAPAAHGRRRAAMAVTVALAVAATGIAAVIATGGATPAAKPRTAHAATAPRTADRHDVAYVVRGLQQALSANTDVLHELVHAPDSQTGAPTIEETWTRGGTDTAHTITLNAEGRPTAGTLVTIGPHLTTSISIDYATRSYTERTYPFGSDAPGPAPAPATPTGQASALRAQVSAGKVALVRASSVNGQQALELRDTSNKGGVIELWVDPSTYLPIQEIDIPAGASADSVQSIRTEYQWLPATDANLAELTPGGAIPPGFQPVSTD